MEKQGNFHLQELDMSFQSENFSGQGDLGGGMYSLTHRIINSPSDKKGSLTSYCGSKPVDGCSSEGSDNSSYNEKYASQRTIIIEPAFAMMFTFFISSALLTGQYIYWAIGEKYNLTSIIGNTSDRTEWRNEGCDRGTYENSSAYLLQQRVQAETAEFVLILELCAQIPGIVVSLFMGTWMDNFGRKPALILPLVGVLLQCTVFVIQQVANLSLYVMIVGTIINACTGGIGTFINACYSYYSDTIPPSKRGGRIIRADLVYGFALALGQVVMGYLIQRLGFLYPYIIIMTGHSVNLLYVIFFVPESKRPLKERKPVSAKFIFDSFKVLSRERPHNGRRVLLLGVLARGVIVFFVWPKLGLLALYLLNSPLCWNPPLIGIFAAFGLVVGNLSQLVLALFLLRRLREIGCLLLSVTCGLFSVLLLAFANTTWLVFLVPLIGFSQGATLPLFRAILSNIVSQEEQGALFACLSATTSIIDMIGGIIFNLLYASTLLFFKGTSFLVMALGLGLALIILGIFRKDFQRNAEDHCNLKQVPKDEVFSIS